MAYDFPDAPANGDIIQTAGQRFEWVAASTRWEWRGDAQFAGGTPVVPGTNTWASATGTTLTSTDCVQLSLDNATWSQSAAVTANGTYYTRWDPGVTCDGAPHGTTITGTIVDSADGTTQTYTKTIDKIPDVFTFSPATNSVGPTTVTPVASFTLSGLNSPASLWGALTTTSGGTAPSTAEYSTDNVTFTAIPAAAGSATVENGQTIYVRFTTGDTTSTTDTLTLRVGESVANSVSGTYVITVSKAAFSPTAPTAPTIADGVTTSCITWDAGADTIYGTGCLEFNVNGGAFTQANTAVVNGDTVCTRWKAGTGVGTTCSDAVHGTTITGTIESATRQFNASLLIDRQPNAFDFTDQTGIALSTQATSNTVTIAGTNADSYLQWTPDATNPLTTVQASINGGAYVAVPAAGTYTLVVPAGATITVQGTTGAGVSTGYTGTFTLGDSVANTTDTWTVTTSAAVPSITAPTVTAPTDASTGITISPTVTTSTYTPLNGAGTHACTDWEVYKNSYPLTSTNTITNVTQNAAGAWTQQTSIPGGDSLTTVSYGNGTFVLGVLQTGNAFTSPDGVAWTDRGNVFPPSVRSSVYAGGLFVMVGANGAIATSPDGVTWTPRTSNVLTADLDQVAYGGGLFMAAGGNNVNGFPVTTSPDGVTWTVAGYTGDSTRSLAYGAGVFVRGTSVGGIQTSTTGASWTTQVSPFGTTITAITFGGGQFVAVGDGGKIATSPDGITWTSRTSGVAINFYFTHYDGAKYWAGGDSGTLVSSPDGINWTTEVSSFGTTSLRGMSSGGENNVMVGDSGKVAKQVLSTTTLTIAGCQTDGFLAGDIIDDCGGGAGPVTITSLDDTQVKFTPQDAGFAIGENICRDASTYTLVSSVVCDAVNLTSYPLSGLDNSTKHYVRAAYKDNTTPTAVTSGFGPWSGFTTEAALVPGDALNGGYFGGQINDGGIIYNLIVAPAASGQDTSGTLAYKNANTAEAAVYTASAQNEVYGFPMSQIGFAGGAATYPALHWARSLSISSYNDWYLPAKNELEVLYYFLKPTTSGTDPNDTSSGSNANAVAPEPVSTNYSSTVPTQTTAGNFQSGGGEAFASANVYQTATEFSGDATRAWRQAFYNGQQLTNNKSSAGTYLRAIRREYANAPVAIGDAFGGGYFAGQYVDGGQTYNLIVAPLTEGALEGQYGGATPAVIQWKTSSTGDTNPPSQDAVYGGTTTNTFANATYPLFDWCVNNATGPNGGSGIGGFTDWYIPAQDELALLCWNLGPNWSTSSTFAGGAQAFPTASSYWSSTEDSSNTNAAWRQNFNNGAQTNPNKASSQYARAVRRQLA